MSQTWMAGSLPTFKTNTSAASHRTESVCVCCHLSCSSKVLQRVDAEAQDVVIVAQIEALTVQLTVVDHAHRRHMEQHLATLSVEQVVPAVVPTIPDDINSKTMKGNLDQMFFFKCSSTGFQSQPHFKSLNDSHLYRSDTLA